MSILCLVGVVVSGSTCSSNVWLLFLIGDLAKVIGYGHLGDGNLHLNIVTPEYTDNVSLEHM